MDFKQHAKSSLTKARQFTESLLEYFKTDDDWFFQATANANHAMWIVGHLALADNAFASKFRPENERKPSADWEGLFWFGSEVSSDRSVYPSKEDVLEYFRERRENLMRVLDEISDEELSAAAPGPDERSAIAGAPNVGHLFYLRHSTKASTPAS